MGGSAASSVLHVALLFAALFSSCVAKVYYVKPKPDTKCPEGEICHTLSEYAQNSSQYFASNATFDFLPGTHALNQSIFIFNISNISFTSNLGNTSQIASWISCTNPALFNFTQVQEIQIENLGFTSCGADTINPRVVFFSYVGKFLVLNSSFVRNKGSAFFISQSSGVVENANFTGNSVQLYGGGAYISNSTVVFQGDILFSGNRAGGHGGAISSLLSNITFLDGVTFYNNSATDPSGSSGGGVALLMTSTLWFRGITIFHSNAAYRGGGIFSYSGSSIHSYGSITFLNNFAGHGGGFVSQDGSVDLLSPSFSENIATVRAPIFLALNSIVLIDGMNGFTYNQNLGFGGIDAEESHVQISGYSIFSHNSASQFGAAIFAFNQSTVILNGTTTFIENKAEEIGGALSVFLSSIQFYGSVEFDSNYARQDGAITVTLGGEVSFTGTTVFKNNYVTTITGGAIGMFLGHLTFNGNTIFDSNHASEGGGAIGVAFSTITINGNCTFTGNSAPLTGGAIYSHHSDITFTGTGEFSNNTCYNGAAISTVGGSTLNFRGSFHFHDNRAAGAGGAIATEQESFIGLMSPLELIFTNNKAMLGGAIFVLDRLTLNFCTKHAILQLGYCFFEVYSSYNGSYDLQPLYDVHLTFVNNTAENGSVLYGGLLQQCIIVFPNGLSDQGTESTIEYFHRISTITTHGNITSVISSDPVQICFCKDDTFYCDVVPTFSRSPGQSFNVSVVALDQSTIPIFATIRTTFLVNSTAQLGDGEQTQYVNPSCTSLQFSVFSSSKNETLQLSAESPCNKLGTAITTVSLHLLRCPDGFELFESHCVCEEDLQRFATTCDVETDSIERMEDFWVNASYNSNGTYEGLIIGSHCPLDYCKSNPVNFTLSDPDAQCAFNHSGILCGNCDPGLSLTLGRSRCAHCSNDFLALLILFAFMGFALVIVISVCKLTVGEGTVNGLIFYANVVAINKTIFFPAGDTNVLTVFIAWVNLDFGIEVCFYDGMDVYTSTWLQFVFPFYVWLLVGVMIFFGKYRYTAWTTKLLGSNPVALLATLFLLSYVKLLRTITAALYYTVLEYPDGSKEAMWLYNGNIRYLHGRHIPLFIFALLVLFLLFIPYTLFLLVGQWLRAKAEYRVLSWIDNLRVKILLDAYYGPYKVEHFYWTGLLLLLRCVLFLVFAFNIFNNLSLNLLVLASSVLGLTALPRLTKGVYRDVKWSLEALESFFLINLGLLAVGTYHINEAGGNQAALTYLSVGVSFVTFLGIALVQALSHFEKAHLAWAWFCGVLDAYLHRQRPEVALGVPDARVNEGGEAGENNPFLPPDHLREPLLTDT